MEMEGEESGWSAVWKTAAGEAAGSGPPRCLPGLWIWRRLSGWPGAARLWAGMTTTSSPPPGWSGQGPGKRAGIRRLGRQQVRRRAGVFRGVQIRRAAQGEWYWRMALSSMYCGDPEEALEEAKKGVEFAPDSPMAWRMFGELSAGLGDRQAALEAVRRGRASLEGASSEEEDAAFGYPLDDWGELEEMILSGAGLEELERARLLHVGQKNGESGSRLERLRLEAARGITEDEAGLLRVKEVLQPEIWDTDTAYCGFCCNFEGRELEGAFYMNEAAVSKWTPEEMRGILKMLPKSTARPAPWPQRRRMTGGF